MAATAEPAGPTAHEIEKREGGLDEGQAKLVHYLQQRGVVRSKRVAEVMCEVDRQNFVDPHFASPTSTYQDTPLPIGGGQTISAPHMHAVALEQLEPMLKPGARVLDVGAGSGYLTVCFAKLLGGTGYVLGVEKLPKLAQKATENIQKAEPGLLAGNTLKVVAGNVLADVLEGEPGFDAIHVGAAADNLPTLLVDKLLPGGRMVIPVGPRWEFQTLTLVDKDAAGNVNTLQLMDVGYVPLVGLAEMEDGWMPLP